MQLSDMVSKVRRRIGSPSTTDVTDATIKEHINAAYREIADNFRFHSVRKLCTFDTVADTRRYGLPTDCAFVIRVRNKDDEAAQPRLEKLDDRRAAELLNSDTTGVPTQYMRYKDWIELEPTPDDVYTIEVFYRADVTDLSDDADEPVFPVAWHAGIVHLATWNYFVEEGDVPKANNAYNIYDLWSSKKTNEVDEEKRDLDSGVEIPTLSNSVSSGLDFNHSD